MNRYDQILGFDRLNTFIRRVPRQKVDYAQMALLHHRASGFGQSDDDAIAQQFGLKGMSEFWEIELSEPMTCKAFGHSLAVHLAATHEPTQGFEAHIRQALRKARSYGEPWFTVIPDPPPTSKLDPKAWMGFVPSDVTIVPPDPPADGIDLNKLRVQPRAAAEWMLNSAMRKHLVPPSLAAYLNNDAGQPDQPDKEPQRDDPPANPEIAPLSASIDPKNPVGRPTSMHLVLAEWRARRDRGEASAVKSIEAKALRQWLVKTHPTAALPKIKTIQNTLSKQTKPGRSP